jgi:hypothetical protein
MRFLLFVLGICVGIVGIWKSRRGSKLSMVRDLRYRVRGYKCGFVTFQQCLNTVSGIGGFCEPNTQYQPTPPVPYRSTRRESHYPY